MGKGLILFLHGLGGDGSTWGIFPQLLRADAEIAERHDIPEPYIYTTTALGRGPGIAELSRELATFLRLDDQAAYSTITVIAHSMGGLITKRLICDALIAGEPVRITRVMSFASPHLGSGITSATSRVPVTGPQHRDLAIGSQFMNALGRDWAAVGADKLVNVRHVIAGNDAVVAEWSGTAGFRTASYDVVGGENHRSIVRPADKNSRSFKLARSFLLENHPLWHRAPDARHYEQPILDATSLMDSSFARGNPARFVFRSRSLPLFGRDKEWAELGQFLTSADPFRWMVMSGSGGVGKSRLALELCISASDNWFAGFLPDSERERDWDRWQPLAPTLMVLDYATRNTSRVRGLLHALARRTMPGATYPLTNPVRALMIVRPGDERSLSDDVVRQGDAVSAVYATGRHKILALQSISDAWPIFEAVFTQHWKSLPDKTVTLNALKRIDDQQRPLFAYFLADAMVHSAVGSPDPIGFDAVRLVEDVIERWRSQFWRPAYAAANIGKGRAEEVLLAVATICGGVPIREGRLPATRSPGLFPSWDTYGHPRLFEVMTGRDAAETVPPLAPDIVGEHFALSTLGERTPDQRTELIDLAWEIDPLGTTQFILRAHNDAPQSDMLQLLRKPPAAREATRYWLKTARDLLSNGTWHNAKSVGSLIEATVSRLDDLRFGTVAIFLVGPRPLTPAQRALADSLWAAVVAQPERFAANALGDQLDVVGFFLRRAREHGQKELVAALYKAMADNPQRLTEQAFSTPLDHLGLFLATAREHGQKELVAALYKAMADNPQWLAEQAFSTPLDNLGSFLATAHEHGQKELVAALYKAMADNPQWLAEQAFSTPLDNLGSFLATAREHGQKELVAALYRAMADNPQWLAEQAFSTPLNNLGSFLATAHEHGQKELVAALYRAMADNLQRLTEQAFSTTLNHVGSFLSTAREHGQKELVAALYKAMADNPHRLTEQAFSTTLDNLGSFLATAHEHGQKELIRKLWQTLAAEPDRLATRVTESTPRTIMPLLVTIPEDLPSVGEAILRPLDLKEWEYGEYRSARFSTGAPGLALTFQRYGRPDLKNALLSNVLRRNNPDDFNQPAHGMLEVSRLLANCPEDDLARVNPFLDTVCTPTWLNSCFRAGSTVALAESLATLATYRGPEICCHFWCSGLQERLENEASRIDNGSPSQLSATVQFVGACALAGWRTDARNFRSAPLDRIGRLPCDELRHKSESKNVQGWQRQLWFGLRVMATHFPGSLKTEQAVIEETLALWMNNVNETSAKPDGSPHRINKSMVRWLTNCALAGSGQLSPDDESLWLLTGFPEDPKAVKQGAIGP